MRTSTIARNEIERRTLDHELAIIHGAIALVASGVSSRVTCAGLRFGSQILAGAQAAASGGGVRVCAIWSLDQDVTELVIEPAGRR